MIGGRPAGALRAAVLASAGTAALLALAPLPGCSPPEPDRGDPSIAVACRVLPQGPRDEAAGGPVREGPVAVEVTLTGSDGGALEGADVRIEAMMSHAGMVPVLAQALPRGGGRYLADLELTMGGDWFLLVEVRLPDGREARSRHELPGVRPR